MGMTPEQFWDGDVWLCKAYRDAKRIRINEANHLAWLQGLYVYQAIGALAPALKAFCKGRPTPYPKEPFALETRENKAAKAQERQKNADDAFSAMMMSWMSHVNKNMAARNETTEGGETADAERRIGQGD